VVDLRTISERRGQIPLQGAQSGFEGADAAVELAVAQKVGKITSEVGVGEPEEVALAARNQGRLGASLHLGHLLALRNQGHPQVSGGSDRQLASRD
jgi:hypothetical protein